MKGRLIILGIGVTLTIALVGLVVAYPTLMTHGESKDYQWPYQPSTLPTGSLILEQASTGPMSSEIALPPAIQYYPSRNGGAVTFPINVTISAPRALKGFELKGYTIYVWYGNANDPNRIPPYNFMAVLDTAPWGIVKTGENSKATVLVSYRGMWEGHLSRHISSHTSSRSYTYPGESHSKDVGDYQRVYTVSQIVNLQKDMCQNGFSCEYLNLSGGWKLRYAGRVDITGDVPSYVTLLTIQMAVADSLVPEFMKAEKGSPLIVIVITAHYSKTTVEWKHGIIPMKKHEKRILMITYVIGQGTLRSPKITFENARG